MKVRANEPRESAKVVKCSPVLIMLPAQKGKTPTPGEPDGRPGGEGEKTQTRKLQTLFLRDALHNPSSLLLGDGDRQIIRFTKQNAFGWSAGGNPPTVPRA